MDTKKTVATAGLIGLAAYLFWKRQQQRSGATGGDGSLGGQDDSFDLPFGTQQSTPDEFIIQRILQDTAQEQSLIPDESFSTQSASGGVVSPVFLNPQNNQFTAPPDTSSLTGITDGLAFGVASLIPSVGTVAGKRAAERVLKKTPSGKSIFLESIEELPAGKRLSAFLAPTDDVLATATKTAVKSSAVSTATKTGIRLGKKTLISSIPLVGTVAGGLYDAKQLDTSPLITIPVNLFGDVVGGAAGALTAATGGGLLATIPASIGGQVGTELGSYAFLTRYGVIDAQSQEAYNPNFVAAIDINAVADPIATIDASAQGVTVGTLRASQLGLFQTFEGSLPPATQQSLSTQPNVSQSQAREKRQQRAVQETKEIRAYRAKQARQERQAKEAQERRNRSPILIGSAKTQQQKTPQGRGTPKPIPQIPFIRTGTPAGDLVFNQSQYLLGSFR